jgi:two-component system response regulator (stage 0 sporulation protein F)
MPKILLVCDDDVLAMLYCEELAEEGYTVVVANKVGQLYSKIESEKPDLVLVDCYLDPYGESDVCEGLNKAGYVVPFIFCSDHPPARREAAPMGMVHWVIRTSDLSNLKTALRKVATGEFLPSNPSPSCINCEPAVAEQISFDWTK